MMPDHYATLGVPATAKAAAIREAYLALMREYHPDRNRDPAATVRAQAVIAAFKVLGDFDRRNHYDWDRRREREAAQATATKAERPRRIRAGKVGAGAIGLAAVAAWVLMPAPGPEPVTPGPKVAEAREVPAAPAKPTPGRRSKRVAVAAHAKVKAKVEKGQAARKVEPRAAPARTAKAEPVRVPVPPKPKAKAKAKRAPVVRVAAVKAPVQRAAPMVQRAVPQSALAPQPRPARVAAMPRPAAKPVTATSGDIASLDQFVMGFYGQSWRYGDAPKRAALEQSRASFVARRGGCAGDTCKRDAYLKLMRDVSAIVESGQPKAP